MWAEGQGAADVIVGPLDRLEATSRQEVDDMHGASVVTGGQVRALAVHGQGPDLVLGEVECLHNAGCRAQVDAVDRGGG